MLFCRLLWMLLMSLVQYGVHAEVPQVLQVQGRFMTQPADASDLSRPIYGTTQKQITVNFRPFLPGGLLDQTLYSYTLNNVILENGVYDLEIPVPQTLPFDRQYALEVVVLSSGGGNIGNVPLVSVPYAFMAKNALKLGGILASAYSRTDHGHDSATKSFTIDGTGQGNQIGTNRFTVINGSSPGIPGFPVFTIDHEGNITKVSLMSFGGMVLSESGLRVLDANGRTILTDIGSTGDASFRNVNYKGTASAASLKVSGTARLENVRIDSRLTFLGSSTIAARPGGEGTPNLIGQTHRLEDHLQSPMMSGLLSLTNGSVVTDGLHFHAVKDNMFTADSLESAIVSSSTIIDGSVRNEDIATSANIPDSALAVIVTPGKVAESALPQNLVFENRNNVFGSGFGSAQAATLVNRHEFDAVRSKQMTILATSGLSSAVLFEAKSFGSEFRWVLESDGALSFRRNAGLGAEETRILIKPQGSRARLELNKFRIDGDPSVVTGAEIQSGAISNAKIVPNSITGAKFQDGAVTASKIATTSITTAKIATGVIAADKIADGSLSGDKFVAAAFTRDKIYGEQESDPEDGKLTNTRFADASINAGKIAGGSLRAENFVTNSIGPEHIVSLTFSEEYIGTASLTGAKISTGVISNIHLRDDVIALRSQPMNIRVNAPTTAVMHIITSNTNQTSLLLSPNAIPNSPTLVGPSIAMQVDNSQTGAAEERFSVHMDGRMSVKSTSYTTTLTLNAYDMAVLFGVIKTTPVAGADCPSIADTGYRSVNPAQSATSEGGGFCIKEVTPAATNWYTALEACYADGAALCSATELLKACRANLLIQTNYVTRDLLDVDGAGTMHSALFAPVSIPCPGTDFNYSSRAVGTADNTRYACCFRP
jgi:hypothetical protein